MRRDGTGQAPVPAFISEEVDSAVTRPYTLPVLGAADAAQEKEEYT